ncbi:MAG TPA: DoxX family protein [Solirubrobacterales bacterium]|nr:DoxX family protein [Solirubrobacterales bacterium]
MRFMFTALRVLIGALFIGHGTQKLFGWFNGHGLEATAGGFDSMGLKPGKATAVVAGMSEAGGGALLASGMATPAAGAALTGTMIQAIRTVHAKNGPWVSNGGWEYNAVLIAAVLAIVEHGPGPFSIDGALDLDLKGSGWALAALAAGIAGPPLVQIALATFAETDAETGNGETPDAGSETEAETA